jgi:hypothetical protein
MWPVPSQTKQKRIQNKGRHQQNDLYSHPKHPQPDKSIKVYMNGMNTLLTHRFLFTSIINMEAAIQLNDIRDRHIQTLPFTVTLLINYMDPNAYHARINHMEITMRIPYPASWEINAALYSSVGGGSVVFAFWAQACGRMIMLLERVVSQRV